MPYHGKVVPVLITTLSLFIASSASALTVTQNITGVFTSGFAPSPTAVITTSTVSNVQVGDIIAFSFDIENAGGDLVSAILNNMTFDTTILALLGGTFQPTILFVPAVPFPPVPSQSLAALTAGPAINISSLPAGNVIQTMAFASAAGSTGAGPDIGAATLFLEIIAPGTTSFDSGFSSLDSAVTINGQTFVGADITDPLLGGVVVNNGTIFLNPVPTTQTYTVTGTSDGTTAWGWQIRIAGLIDSTEDPGPIANGLVGTDFAGVFAQSISNAPGNQCTSVHVGAPGNPTNMFEITCPLPFDFYVTDGGVLNPCMVTNTIGGPGCNFNPTIVQILSPPSVPSLNPWALLVLVGLFLTAGGVAIGNRFAIGRG